MFDPQKGFYAATIYVLLSSECANGLHMFGLLHLFPEHLSVPCFVCWPGSMKAESERKPVNERTLLDNASNVLTNLLSGGNMGTMPIAEGAVSDLFGRPLFFALYDWFIQVKFLCTPCNLSRILL